MQTFRIIPENADRGPLSMENRDFTSGPVFAFFLDTILAAKTNPKNDSKVPRKNINMGFRFKHNVVKPLDLLFLVLFFFVTLGDMMLLCCTFWLYIVMNSFFLTPVLSFGSRLRLRLPDVVSSTSTSSSSFSSKLNYLLILRESEVLFGSS